RPVSQDVALDPAQHPEWRQRLVCRRDLLALAQHVVSTEPGNGAHAGRVVADREVLVAARDRALGHLEHRRLAVGPGRVAVEVAAYVFALDERRRSAAMCLLAELRRAVGDAKACVDLLLRRSLRQR